jgi:dihydroorotate dehydrogenase (NAD+) catalytic subunit
VSGPAVRAIALAQIAEVRARVSIPVVGMGGIQTGAHAHALRRAGADIVAVGTESFRDPLAGARVAASLAEIEQKNSAKSRVSRGPDGGIAHAVAH